MKATTTKVYTNKNIKIMRFIGMLLIAAILFTMPVFASANYGEKGATWLIGEMGWVAIAAVIIMAIKFFLSGNFVKLGINVVIGVLVIAMIGMPESLKTLGTNLWNATLGAAA